MFALVTWLNPNEHTCGFYVLINTNLLHWVCFAIFSRIFNICSFAWMKQQQGGFSLQKKKKSVQIFPPLHFMPRPLSLGQALELGQGEERKQNKSLPDSSSNSTHSHSTQRERQTTRGQTFFSVLYFVFDLFACTFFFLIPRLFFFSSPEQTGTKRKGPTLKSETKKPKESWNVSEMSDDVCSSRV